MISLYELKPKFQNLLRPLVKKLASAGITANQVTITAMVLSAIVGALISMNSEQKVWFFLVPILLFVRMALNAIDGMLAREHNMQTSLGTILNELGDVISDAVLYLPFALLADVSGELIVGIVILAIISEMAGVLGLVIGASRRYDGPMGKSDRAFVFGLLALLIAIGIPIAAWIHAVLWIMIALILLNIVQRVRKALQEVH